MKKLLIAAAMLLALGVNNSSTYAQSFTRNGKTFVKRVSKKTGKEYKQYLPEIGKQINPEAYKDKK